MIDQYKKNTKKNNSAAHGVGAKPAAIQAAIQAPRAKLQATIAAGMPTPAVTVPKVKPM